MMLHKYTKYKKAIIKISISVLLISLLLLSINREQLISTLKTLNFAYVPLIIVLIIANYVISSIRWKQLLSIYPKSENAPTSYLVGLYFIGSFFNNFMPTSIGGDVYKIVKLGARIESKAHAFSATFMERFTGVVSLAFIALFGFIITLLKGFSGYENDFLLLGIVTVAITISFIIGGIVAFKLLGTLSNKITKLQKINDSLSQYTSYKKVLIVAFLTSFVVQLCSVFTQYFILSALNTHLDVFRSLFIFPIITLASFFIPSLNGIGVQDFLYKFSNGFLLILEPTAIAASILYHIFRLIVSLFGGVLYAMGKSD